MSTLSPLSLEILKTGLNLLVALTTLGLTWFIGQGLAVGWNLEQKRRETDIAILQEFYSLYGEFKEIGKIWRIIKKNYYQKYSNLEIPPPANYWLLLSRACAVEGKNEAIMVKLATERNLDESDLRALGLFRQAVQQLRESIRDKREIPSFSRGTEYVFFNNLAAQVGFIISSSKSVSSDPQSVSERLRILANVRCPDYENEIKRFKGIHPEYSQGGHHMSDLTLYSAKEKVSERSPSEEERLCPKEQLTPQDMLQIWQHFANVGGNDKDRMVNILALMLPLATGTIAYIATQLLDLRGLVPDIKPDNVQQVLIVAIVGLTISFIGMVVVLMYAGCANWNWAQADEIARIYFKKVKVNDHMVASDLLLPETCERELPVCSPRCRRKTRPDQRHLVVAYGLNWLAKQPKKPLAQSIAEWIRKQPEKDPANPVLFLTEWLANPHNPKNSLAPIFWIFLLLSSLSVIAHLFFLVLAVLAIP